MVEDHKGKADAPGYQHQVIVPLQLVGMRGHSTDPCG